MALRLTLICIAVAICFFQLISAIPRVPRDTEAATNNKDINDALDAVKTGFDNIVKNIQENDMLKNLTSMIQKFGEEVSDQGKHLVKKIQEGGSN